MTSATALWFERVKLPTLKDGPSSFRVAGPGRQIELISDTTSDGNLIVPQRYHCQEL